MAHNYDTFPICEFEPMPEIDRNPRPVEWHGPIGLEHPDPDVWEGQASAKKYDFGPRSLEFFEDKIPLYYKSVTLEVPVTCVDKRFSGVVGILYNLVQGNESSDELLDQVLVKENGRFSSKILRGEEGLNQLRSMAQLIRRGENVMDSELFQALREEVEAEPLGPKTVGASNAMAYSYRAAIGVEPGATLPGDIEEIASKPDEFKPGGHKDELAVFPKIGCKAVDEDITILYLASGALNHSENQRLTKFLLGYKPDAQLEHDVYASLNKMNREEFKNEYFMRKSGVDTHRQAGLDVLEGTHGSEIEIVTGGPENAVFFLVNRCEGETFHKNLWGLDLMGEGIFNPPGAYSLDFWRSQNRAETLFPDNETRRRRFLKARCLYAASTLMVLCDGSLILGERRDLDAAA
jgi:hypothetical protein